MVEFSMNVFLVFIIFLFYVPCILVSRVVIVRTNILVLKRKCCSLFCFAQVVYRDISRPLIEMTKSSRLASLANNKSAEHKVKLYTQFRFSQLNLLY